MDKQDGKSSDEHLEAEVWNAISAFEQIIEAMPNDRASLEALSHAYEQIGDLTRAKDYLARYAQALLDEQDASACKDILPKLRDHAAQDSVLADKLARIESLLKQQAEATEAPQPARLVSASTSVARESGFSMSDEMSFAWNLSEAHQITEEEYAGIVQDLTEMSSSTTSTVSVLHVLDHRRFKNLEKVVAHVSGECNTPFISLSSFSIGKQAFSLLPPAFMLRRGVMIFDLLGQDALAVIMNPYNMALQKEVEAMAGRTCHFFMTLPAEFDAVLSRAAEILAQEDD